MKVSAVEVLQADAGWRLFSFVKLATDDGIIVRSEYNGSFGSIGLGDVVRVLAPLVVLQVSTRQPRGGLNHQAIARPRQRRSACAARRLGYALFGNPAQGIKASKAAIHARIPR